MFARDIEPDDLHQVSEGSDRSGNDVGRASTYTGPKARPV